MSRGVSFEQVSAVCDQLTHDGHEPTNQVVREQLGTGSMSTISKHLKKWKASRPVEAKFEDMPKEVVSLLAAAGRAAWTAAQKQSIIDLEGREKELLEREKYIDRLLQERNSFEMKYNAQKTTESALQAENRTKKAELDQVKAILKKEEQTSFQYKMELKDTRKRCEDQAHRLGRYEAELKLLKKKK